jgi:glycosyltransferase involved in cell wall biosynthesis
MSVITDPVPPLKIGYLMQTHMPEMDEVTGPQAHVKSTVHTMEQRGHRVRMVATQADQVQWSDDLVQWQPAVFGPSQSRPFRLAESVIRGGQSRLGLPFIRLFDSFRYSDACVSALKGFDILYERYGFLGYGGVMAARRLKIPIILEVNGDIVEDYANRGMTLSRAQWAAAHFVTRLTYKFASHIIVVDHSLVDRLAARWQVNPQRISVVTNGTNYPLFSAKQDVPAIKQKYKLPCNPSVAYVGGFQPWQGVEVLARALKIVHAHLPEVSLVLIGDGPEHANIARLTSELGLDRHVFFMGRRQPEEVAEILSTADIAAAPYRYDHWRDAPGLKVYEYMAAGKPIISSAKNGRHAALEHLETGYLVDSGDVDQLAQAILFLLQNNTVRVNMGRNVQARAAKYHTWDHTVAQIEKISWGLLKEN